MDIKDIITSPEVVNALTPLGNTVIEVLTTMIGDAAAEAVSQLGRADSEEGLTAVLAAATPLQRQAIVNDLVIAGNFQAWKRANGDQRLRDAIANAIGNLIGIGGAALKAMLGAFTGAVA
jgi:hypothetical protein